MSDIDFQNGFICGMATKGLIKSVPQDSGESSGIIIISDPEPLTMEVSLLFANMIIGEVILI